MNQRTSTPELGNQSNPSALPFQARIALVCYGLKELRRQHNGFAAIEQLLRRNEDAEEPSRQDLFYQDLSCLLATVNTVFEEKIDFLIGLAEATQQEVLQ